jgi:hypothetical protein
LDLSGQGACCLTFGSFEPHCTSEFKLNLTDLLFYDKAAGEGVLYGIGSSGTITRLQEYENWRTTWDIILPGEFVGVGDNYSDLLFYDKSAGEGVFYDVYPTGTITRFQEYENWRTTWGIILPGEFGQ